MTTASIEQKPNNQTLHQRAEALSGHAITTAEFRAACPAAEAEIRALRSRNSRIMLDFVICVLLESVEKQRSCRAVAN